jgi:hypothetical protein
MTLADNIRQRFPFNPEFDQFNHYWNQWKCDPEHLCSLDDLPGNPIKVINLHELGTDPISTRKNFMGARQLWLLQYTGYYNSRYLGMRDA